MSHHDSYYYELERKRQEQLARQNAQRDVMNAIARYRQSVQNMINEGLDKYISIENINMQINTIEKIVNTSPFEARNLSYQLSSDINYLRNEALNRKREEERIIKEQKNKNKQAVLDYFNKTISAINDIILIDFARDKFDMFRNELLNDEGVTDKEMSVHSKNIESRIKSIIDEANANAGEWRAKKEKERGKRVLQTKIEDIEDNLKKENIESKENIEKRDKLLKQIETAKESLNNSSDNIENVVKDVEIIDKETDDIRITEEVRKEVVKSIIKSLKGSEFEVSAPELIKDDNGGIVRIIAKKPSGKRAVCKVGLNGKLEYIFDNYEGLTCVKDIDKFNKDLEEIYSIKLSDKKVLWENPDKISKGAIDIDKHNERTL
ncbi:hypothetical protein [uncultured Brachyspira sp.]|uniref:hypothetical protein n=1 Tax=uncultured Brachyspira sp. TaxID=221953 RepID=UPI0026147AD3|nr:hypothetical protein [uncultured Brachyspira sp.]